MKDKLLIFLKEWEESKKFSNLKSVVKAKTEDIVKFLNQIATHKGEKSWLVVPPNSKSKICLVAHIDRIFEHKHQKMKIEYEGKGAKKKWSSPHGIGGDDRCGVYGLIHVYRSLPAEKRPYILFTHEEETGLFGAKEAVEVFADQLKDVDFFVELDRKGHKDMVFYNDEPKSFEKHIGKHDFEKAWGSTSDIKVLGRKFHKKSVNVSVGYYNQHTKGEYIIVKHLLDSLEKVKNICIKMEPSPEPDWKFKEKEKGWGGSYYSSSYDWGDWQSGGWQGHSKSKTPYKASRSLKSTDWEWTPPKVEPKEWWKKEVLDTKQARKLAKKTETDWTIEDERIWQKLKIAKAYKDKYDLSNAEALEFAERMSKLKGTTGRPKPKLSAEQKAEGKKLWSQWKESGSKSPFMSWLKEKGINLLNLGKKKEPEPEQKRLPFKREDANEKDEMWNRWVMSGTKLPFHQWLKELKRKSYE